jgi:hypothetical protein
VVLTINDEIFTQQLSVEIDPEHPSGVWLEYEELEEEFFRSDEETEEVPDEDQDF